MAKRTGTVRMIVATLVGVVGSQFPEAAEAVDPLTTRTSVASDGTQGDSHSLRVRLSDDGRIAVFQSAATNLVPNDTNGFNDVFLRDLRTGITERVQRGPSQ